MNMLQKVIKTQRTKIAISLKMKQNKILKTDCEGSPTYCVTFVKMFDHIRNVSLGCIPYVQSVIPVGVVG